MYIDCLRKSRGTYLKGTDGNLIHKIQEVNTGFETFIR